MVFRNSLISALAVIVLFVFLVSCEEDLDTIGDGVINSQPFETDKAEFDVFAFNRSVAAVQTNRLPVYQLGVYNDPLYGRREAKVTSQVTFPNGQGNPVFGNFDQNLEDLPEAMRGKDTIPENETIKKVVLYLPYQQTPDLTNDRDNDGIPDELESPEDRDDPNSDQDNDGLSDIQENTLGTNPFDPDTDGDGINDADDENTARNLFANTFSLDSILSRRYVGLEGQAPYLGETFTLRVEQSTFFLRNLDPNSNFEENQEYFSNTDITTFTEGEPLFEGEVTIDNKEIVTRFEDDPETEDEDESLIIAERLPPGIQVTFEDQQSLQFFQENILNKEGSFELLSQSNLSEFIRGFHFSIIPNNEDLLVLFDLSQANITITYEFDDFVRESVDGQVVESIDKVERDFTLNFLQVQNSTILGNAVNTFIDDPLPPEVFAQLDNDQENASRLYLKGGTGTFAELRLFDRDFSIAEEIIDTIRANNWVINEANLIFYVDRPALDLNGGTLEPSQLYLYDKNSNSPLFNISPAQGFTSLSDLLRENFGGDLERGSDGKGTKYTVRITDYINNLVVRDSTLSPLALSVTSDLLNTTTLEAESVMGERIDLPVANTLNPLGTVLFGSNIPLKESEKKLKLQIFFTETD